MNDDEDEGSLPISRPCGKMRWGWRGVEGKVGLKGHFYPTTTLTQAGFQLKRTAEARTNRSQVESVQTPRARAGGFRFPPGWIPSRSGASPNALNKKSVDLAE